MRVSKAELRRIMENVEQARMQIVTTSPAAADALHKASTKMLVMLDGKQEMKTARKQQIEGVRHVVR